MPEKLGGQIGITSPCDKAAGEEGKNDVNCGFIHSSLFCESFIKAIFRRSDDYMTIISYLTNTFKPLRLNTLIFNQKKKKKRSCL